MANIPSAHLAKVRVLFDEFFELQPTGLRFKSSALWTANGTFSVTLAEKGPAGITGSAIAKWLTLVDDNGVVHFIPAWT